MFTVIIPDRGLSQSLEEYGILLEPFLQSGKMAVCPWEAEEIEQELFLSRLSDATAGKGPWRALILTDTASSIYENPFDYRMHKDGNSSQGLPLVRLTHILGQKPREGLEKGAIDSPLSPRERPSQLYLCSTRYLPEYAAEEKLEDKLGRMGRGQKPSEFWQRNGYAWQSRFLVFDVEYRRGRILDSDLLKFWLAILALGMDEEAADKLHAFHLYRLELRMDEAVFAGALAQRCAEFAYLHKALLVRENANQKKPVESGPVLEIPVQLTGEEIAPESLYVSPKHLGFFSDSNRTWKRELQKAEQNATEACRISQRSLDEAAEEVRESMKGFQPIVLTARQQQEIHMETLKHEEGASQLFADQRKGAKELTEKLSCQSKEITKLAAHRVTKRAAIISAALTCLIYWIGGLPYLWNTGESREELFWKLAIVVSGMLIIAAAAFLGLLHLRRPMKTAIRKFNEDTVALVIAASAKRQRLADYLTEIRAAMRGWKILGEDGKLTEEEQQTEHYIRRHLYALQKMAAQYRRWALWFGYSVEKIWEPITFVPFELSVLPEENPAYWLPSEEDFLPVQGAGRMPYCFVTSVEIHPEEVTEDAVD